MSRKISIVEVGPRDGLQNEKKVLSEEVRLQFARRLAKAGIKNIELGAFVSPKWVPQMAGSGPLMQKALQLQRQGEISKDVIFSALVPNQKGMEDAIQIGVKNVSIFASASETFSQKNINCSIEESFVRFTEVLARAKPLKMKVRGYLSMCFGCPFEGEVPEQQVVRLVKRLTKLGVYEVSIGDTIGVAHPKQVRSLVGKLVKAVGSKKLAMHFHDTRGTALANILASLDFGIRTFDSSLGGLGGCPHAPAATGNVATEDVLYMLHGMGFSSGINLPELIAINKWMAGEIGHELPSLVGKAGLPRV